MDGWINKLIDKQMDIIINRLNRSIDEKCQRDS